MTTALREAAAARAAQIRQSTDRPSRRRSAPEGRGAYVGASARVELRTVGESTGLTFTGIASVTERGYSMWDAFGEYQEIVSRDAFGDTLQRDGLDVPLVIGHDQLRRIARTTNDTLQLAQGPDGLEVRAPNLDPSDPDVQYVQTKMRQGLLDEMSFGFRIESGSWSPDYTEYRINKVDLHRGDVSIVGWGANPFTSGGIRSDDADMQRRLQKLRLARLDAALTH